MSETETNTAKAVETQIWEPHPDQPGFLRKVRNRTAREIYNDLNKVLKEENLIDEYFSMGPYFLYEDNGDMQNRPLPDFRCILCSAHTGTNEGHYISVDLVLQDKMQVGYNAVGLFMGKTFQGMDHAFVIAKRCAELLGC